jgi:hypothetical protein
MIEALQKFDTRTAAAILARAALALENAGNPAARLQIDGEEALRLALWCEARREIGADPDDNSPEVIERVADWLDQLSDEIIGPTDTASALVRLAERGDLPSDLYNIKIVSNVVDIYKHQMALEEKLIAETVQSPDIEQHYGPDASMTEPAMVSLFCRAFSTPWPAKNFLLLVAGQRAEGLLLEVNQAWRVYPFLVDISGVGADLVQMLKRFADVYGADIKYGGREGHFFILENEPLPSSFSLKFEGRRAMHVNISGFSQHDEATGRERAALVLCINLDKYQADLKRMMVSGSQITPYRMLSHSSGLNP